jgi:hypothetical protein
VSVLGEAFGCERDLTIEVVLKEREAYGVYFEIDWDVSNSVSLNRDVVLSGYS